MNSELELSITSQFNCSPDSGILYRNGKEVGTKSYHGYLKVTFKGVEYLVHRLCWFLCKDEWPEAIDHINHNKCDNRLENIRGVTTQVSNMNQSLRPSNKSGLSGVYWCKSKLKWRAQIRIDGKKTNLGTFSTLLDAAAVMIKSTMKYGYHKNHGKTYL